MSAWFDCVGVTGWEQELVQESRGGKSDFEVAAEILGGGNGRKASSAEIAKTILAGPPKE